MTWAKDRAVLEAEGLGVEVLREYAAYVEVRVHGSHDSVEIQWAQDSAYRFFPLVEHDEFGLVLHPFDLATNKVLALIGRVEARDWIDTMTCNDAIQPLGYLAFAACGKDPSFSPYFVLDEARRTARYSKEEIAAVAFDGAAPDPVGLCQSWRAMLGEADKVICALPSDEAGRCVITADGNLFRGLSAELPAAIAAGALRFHSGAIRGAWPTVT